MSWRGDRSDVMMSWREDWSDEGVMSWREGWSDVGVM